MMYSEGERNQEKRAIRVEEREKQRLTVPTTSPL